MAEDEKKTESEASGSPYSITISIVQNKLSVHIHDSNTKHIYHDLFTPDQLLQCGFSKQQVSNLKGIGQFIAKAKEGHNGLKFSVSIETDSDKEVINDTENEGASGVNDSIQNKKNKKQGTPFGMIRISKTDDFFGTMNFVLKVKQMARDKVDILQDHISDLKNEIKQLKKQQMPTGCIIMWSGSIDNIPDGWLLCDGKNKTPDLRSRFIIGASNEIAFKSTGGTKSHSHNIIVNGHALTVQEMPQHAHGLKLNYGNKSSNSSVSGSDFWPLVTNDSSSKTDWGGREITEQKGSGQQHSHSASSSTNSNLPPYFAMAFIYKI
eukprot:548822_1